MSSSARLYDAAYIVSHLLRLSSYLCALAGLTIAMYQLIQEQRSMLVARAQELQREIASRKSVEETLRAARTNQSLSSAHFTS